MHFCNSICICLAVLISSELCESFSIPQACSLGNDISLPVTGLKRSFKPEMLESSMQFLSRSQITRALIWSGVSFIFHNDRAMGAVPSLSEYNVGSGTVVKPKDQPASEKLIFTDPVDGQSTLKALDETQAMLDKFKV